jgi:hypothetical protein
MWLTLDQIADGITEDKEETKMKISIDYDDTYTKDPLLWNWFAQQALDRGHKVYCVSARGAQHMDDPKMTIGQIIGPDNCFGTGLRPKRHFMWHVHGIYIDVWIDDQPEMIIDDATEGLYMP